MRFKTNQVLSTLKSCLVFSPFVVVTLESLSLILAYAVIQMHKGRWVRRGVRRREPIYDFAEPGRMPAVLAVCGMDAIALRAPHLILLFVVKNSLCPDRPLSHPTASALLFYHTKPCCVRLRGSLLGADG